MVKIELQINGSINDNVRASVLSVVSLFRTIVYSGFIALMGWGGTLYDMDFVFILSFVSICIGSLVYSLSKRV